MLNHVPLPPACDSFSLTRTPIDPYPLITFLDETQCDHLKKALGYRTAKVRKIGRRELASVSGFYFTHRLTGHLTYPPRLLPPFPARPYPTHCLQRLIIESEIPYTKVGQMFLNAPVETGVETRFHDVLSGKLRIFAWWLLTPVLVSLIVN